MSPHLLAYLDAGTGAVLVQALVGGVAGIVVVVKMGGRKFLSFLPIIGKKYRQENLADSVEDADEDPAREAADDTDLAALLEDAADS